MEGETAGAVAVILGTVAVMLLVTHALGVLGEPAPRVAGSLSLALVPTGENLWSFETAGPIHSSPSTDGERIYFGSNDGRVYALSPSGRSLWSFKTGGAVVSSPLVWENTVYAGSYDGRLYALEKGSGRMRWNFQAGELLRLPPSRWQDLIILPTPSGTVYALSSENGEPVWERSIGSSIGPLASLGFSAISPVAVWENTIYVGTWEGELHALRAENGEPLWSLPPMPALLTIGFLVQEGRIYLPVCTPIGSYLWCLENGRRVWYYYLGDTPSSPALWGGRVYVGDEAGVLHCLDAASGEELWSYRTGGAIASPPSFLGEELYVGSRDNGVYCLDTENGTLRGYFPTGGPVTSSPLPLGDRLYVASSDGRLYCLNLADSLLVVRWRGERMENAFLLENGRVEWRDLRLRVNGKRLRTSWAALNGDSSPGPVSLEDGDLLELSPSPPLKGGDMLTAAYAPADQLLGFWRIASRAP